MTNNGNVTLIVRLTVGRGASNPAQATLAPGESANFSWSIAKAPGSGKVALSVQARLTPDGPDVIDKPIESGRLPSCKK